MKKTLIIIGIVISLIIVFLFGFNYIPNGAIQMEETVTTAQSEMKIQEKRRMDLLPNLVDCVKQYDKHEYETLLAIVNGRNDNSTNKTDDDVTTEIKNKISIVAEAYPQLQSQENYKNLMTELAVTENKIATARTHYNSCVARYSNYCRKFPNKQILSLSGYEKQDFQKLNFDVSEDAPTNLFE